MKDSEVYLRAAKSLARATGIRATWGSCDVIRETAGHLYTDCRQDKEYGRLFRPEGAENNECYWGDEWSDTESEVRDCRVLALLFMHQIALDEERKS